MPQYRNDASSFYADRLVVLLPVVVFVLLSILVGPNRNFPLNDDWQYAHVARSFAETGVFKVDVPVAPTLFLQSWMGAAVTRVFGFSFENLRWLTVAVASVVLLLVYSLQRRGGASTGWSLIATLSLVVNPLWLHLTQSFMTEVYGVFVGLTGVWLWFRYRRSPVWRCAAALVMGASFWVRQFSVLVFPAILMVEVFSQGREGVTQQLRRQMFSYLCASFCFLLPVVAYFVWARASGNDNPAFALPFKKLLLRPGLGHWVVQFPILVFYLTAVFLPLLVGGWVGNRGKLRAVLREARPWGTGLTGTLALWAVLAWFFGDSPYGVRGTLHRTFPFLGNVISPFGLGPLTLSDVYLGPGLGPIHTPIWSWVWFEIVLVLVACTWAPVVRGMLGLSSGTGRLIAHFGIAIGVLTFFASVQAYLFAIFDRYHFQAMLGMAIALPIALTAVVGPPRNPPPFLGGRSVGVDRALDDTRPARLLCLERGALETVGAR